MFPYIMSRWLSSCFGCEPTERADQLDQRYDMPAGSESDHTVWLDPSDSESNSSTYS